MRSATPRPQVPSRPSGMMRLTKCASRREFPARVRRSISNRRLLVPQRAKAKRRDRFDRQVGHISCKLPWANAGMSLIEIKENEVSMTYTDPRIVRSIYGQLVRECGGVDAASALLGVAKGTISKQLSGQAEIGYTQVAVLEDTVGRYPLTDLLSRRREAAIGCGELGILAETAVTEVGDVAPAILRLISSGNADQLLKELPEAISALQALVDRAREGG